MEMLYNISIYFKYSDDTVPIKYKLWRCRFMSIKVWAKNNETGEILHINSIDKSYKGKMVCLDENCGEVLHICMGEKKKPYFSHSRNKTCNGGGVETLLHLLSRQVIAKCKYFVVPEESIIFRGKKFLFNKRRKVFVSEVISGEVLEQGFKTGLKLVTVGEGVFYIEAGIRGISAARRAAYDRHDARVIEVDLRKFAGNENIDEDELRDYILGYDGIKTFVCSPNIHRISNMIQSSLYTSNGDIIACPVRNYEVLVDKVKCKKCPFYMYSREGVITCSGKGCYSDISDFSIPDRDIRVDKYLEVLPKASYVVDKYYEKYPLGYCKKCKHKLELAVSEHNPVIRGIRVISRNNSYVYTYCPACRALEPILCPKCGGKMRLCVNSRSGRVFLCCEHYNKSATASEKTCYCSLTVFSGEPCSENFADELLNVGVLSDFLNGKKMPNRK